MNDENKKAFRDLMLFQIPILIWIMTLIVALSGVGNYMNANNISFFPIGIFIILIAIINLIGIVLVIKNHDKNI